MGVIDIVLVLAIGACLFLAVRSRLRARKRGKSCCGCADCAGCGEAKEKDRRE